MKNVMNPEKRVSIGSPSVGWISETKLRLASCVGRVWPKVFAGMQFEFAGLDLHLPHSRDYIFSKFRQYLVRSVEAFNISVRDSFGIDVITVFT